MILSALQEYGIRCLLQLARQPLGCPMTVREVAHAEGLSTDYVEKILNHLRNEGLTTSVRGVNGGYLLAQPATEITLAKALRALGGLLYGKGFCNRFPGLKEECNHLTNCGIRPVWAFITREIYRVLSHAALSDFLNEEAAVVHTLQQQRLNNTENGEWRIENGDN
jgi:Rrf2 family protein